jgi:hypothetical protein
MTDNVDGDDTSDGVSQPVTVYTGSKIVADAKIRLGRWLEGNDT